MALEDDKEWKAIKRETHKVFLSNLLRGKTATESYQIAFPTANKVQAGKKGYELKKRYELLLERHAPIPPLALESVANKTLENLSIMAFADVGELTDSNGKPLPLKEIPAGLRMAITEVEISGKRVKYKIGGKVKALEILSRVARLHEDKTEINISLITEEERDNKIKEIVVRAMDRNSGGDEGEDD